MVAETIRIVEDDPWRMECLEAVASLGLPDWYIAAGFLRNAIWDALHARSVRTPLNDVDVIYYDPVDVGTSTEGQIESMLRARCPTATWEARNQARMHVRHGHAPYRDSAHAIAHWVETPTCVGVRIGGDRRLEIVAPYGIEENWSLRVAPQSMHPVSRRPVQPAGAGEALAGILAQASSSVAARETGMRHALPR